MLGTDSSSKLKIDLKINGNKRDSRTDWEDARNKIVRTCAIQVFLTGVVGSIIPWSIVPERRREQERGINLALNLLVEMAGSPTVRTFIRNIENNRLTNPPLLAEDVDKIRQIVHYYDQLTTDNNTKDIELLRLLQGIKFESTGKTNLAVDVVTYFEKIAKNQDETQPEHKMSNFQSVAMCSAHLSQVIPSLRSPMSNLRLMDMNFAQLRDSVDEICQNIEVHKGHHYDNEISSNSTSKSQRDELITISSDQLKGVIMTAVKHFRDAGRSTHRGGRSSESRGVSKSRSPSRFSGSSSPGSSRGRSRSNDKQDQAKYSGKKAKHLQFSSSTNSTQIIGIQSDDDDIDAELVDSLCGDYFDTWSSK